MKWVGLRQSGFNTRRCDWRIYHSVLLNSFLLFQYPKVRLKVNDGTGRGSRKNAFQYPKVRLKVGYSHVPLSTVAVFQYPKVRLKVKKGLISKDEYESFNTRRCDWRWNISIDSPMTSIVSIPEGAIEGFFSCCPPKLRFGVSIPEGAIEGSHVCRLTTVLAGFNTRRCDWRLFWARPANAKPRVSIPEGAIEGKYAPRYWTSLPSFNTRRCDWRKIGHSGRVLVEKFQYPKVRLKDAST